MASRGLSFGYPKTKYDTSPFPHAIVKGGWNESLLYDCKFESGRVRDWDFDKNGKRALWDSEKLPPCVAQLITEANSPRFLHWLEELTREDCLIPDPYLKGGGIHQIRPGGFLGMHADFNWHDRLRLYRRLNLLLYLNNGWREEWGGVLMLGDKKVLPLLNTMVVFTTDDKSYHGHPVPTTVVRDSIALYYYSAIEPKNFTRRDVTLYA